MEVLLDTLVVKFKVWDDSRITGVVHALGGKIRLRMAPIRWVSVEIDHAQAADLFLAYERHMDVEDVTFDEAHHVQSNQPYNQAFNEPLLTHQWNLHRMNVLPAWKHATGAGIKVCIVDDGLRTVHRTRPEYDGKVESWNGHYDAATYYAPDDEFQEFPVDATTSKSNPFDFQHGLATSGLAVARATNDGIGPSGVAPDAGLVNMAAWSHDSTPGALTATGMTNGFIQAVDRFGAKVISMSATGLVPVGTPLPSYWADTLAYLQDKALCFAASGNDGQGAETHGKEGTPASSFPLFGGFAVGCTTYEELDRPVDYANFGAYVNVVAPGHRVWTPHWTVTQPAQFTAKAPAGWSLSLAPDTMYRLDAALYTNYRLFDGTSAATPLAAGVAALIWSVNPSLTAAQVRAVYLAALDKPTNWLFGIRFPNAGIPNALKGVLHAKALTTPGSVFPYLGFIGPGVSTTVAAGVATTHLRGPLRVEIDGYSTDAITGVEFWAGTKLVYSGLPRKGADALLVHAGYLTDGALKVVVSTASATVEETYTDLVTHGMSGPVAPPVTTASHAAGTLPEGTLITLSVAESDAHPVRISYRWGAGAWQRYAGPIAVQTGTLAFYGVDAFGNVEGGVDYDP
jgi:hypothetical protein